MVHIAEIYFRAWRKASGKILEVFSFFKNTNALLYSGYKISSQGSIKAKNENLCD